MRPLLAAFLLCVLLPSARAADAPTPDAVQAFLMSHAHAPGVMVRPSGLQYRILRSGFGKRVGPRDIVQVQFSASLINGVVVDGTSPGLPSTLAVGSVIRGLSEALQLMHEGDHWQLVVPPSLAFGAAGSGTAIPPNQVLLFDITLLSATTPSGPALADPQISLSPMNRREGTYQEQGAILTSPQ